MVNALNKNIVNETFNCAYSEKQFTEFINDLLVGANYNIDEKINLQGYENFIRSAKKFCEYRYKLPDYNDEHVLDVIVVKLRKTSSLDRARTAQRNFVARYLNGGRDYQKDAALVAFISEDENGNIAPDWRFSLVQMSYKTEFRETASGKKKIKTSIELTPAKRFSFLVGANENTHTAQKQFYTCLEKSTKGEQITIEDLVQAFDIEKVSKEFFEKYKALYLKLRDELIRLCDEDTKVREDFETHSINLDDFAKKTLGQLVFLYFIQKKGWLGVKRDDAWDNGDKKFLRNLFNKKYCEYNNFFNDVLEHLFYEALASDRGSGAWFDKLNCRIPFLNGGLFEPVNGYEYEKTDLTISNNIFKEIFDTFDLYNFTVKEDEPLEKEVAIDPEMLGKVFENLLPENTRKGNGAFYTPREIVHYMCQESLINYIYNKINIKEVPLSSEEKAQQLKLLKTKKEKEQLKLTHEVVEEIVSKEDITTFIKRGNAIYKNKMVKEELPQSIIQNAQQIDKTLETIKVCDPAIGSGAFPVGMMNEIVRARATLNEYIGQKECSIYQFKRNAIENSIYGVDIDPGAVDIAKLRFWLSLVVDEENIKEIKPLPNLDYKIMQGNSLITSYEGLDFDEIVDEYKPNTQLSINLWGDKTQDIKLQIKNKQIEFLKNPHATEKQKLKQDIENLIIDLLREELENKAKDNCKPKSFYEEKIRNFIQNKEKRNFFPWKLFFADAFEQGGFDIVIANPPYVGQKGNKDKFEIFKNCRKWENFYERKQDLYYYFIAEGINLLCKQGCFVYIIPPYFVTAEGGKNIRKYIIDNSNIIQIVNLSGKIKVFENASIDNFILFLNKQNKDKNIVILEPDLLNKNYMSHFTKYNSKYATVNLSEKEWFLLKDNNVIEINSKNIIKLGSIANISPGIQTGCDKLTEKHIKVHNLKNVKSGEGIFVISDKEKRETGFTNEELKYIKPFYKNSDIYKYGYINNIKYWIIITNEIENINNTPNIKKHLHKYKSILDARYRNFALLNADKDGKWWYLYGYRPNTNFTQEKIIFPYRASINKFAYSSSNFYSSIDIFYLNIINSNYKYKYILSILNSNLILYWLSFNCKKKGNIYELYQKPISQIPIKKATKDIQQKFVDIVDKILSLTQSEDYLENNSKQEAVKQYEKQIDIMVYKLYELTYEEVLTIDNNFQLSEKEYISFNI